MEIMKKSNIKNLIRKGKEFFFRKLSKASLWWRFNRTLEVEKMMESWVTKSIIDRKQEGRREELVQKQNKIKEMTQFLEYLKTIK